jgi:hypothetical protein
VRSTILTSQLPVSCWHKQVDDPTLADGILDRLVHNAHRIEMRGDSMRKNRGEAEHIGRSLSERLAAGNSLREDNSCYSAGGIRWRHSMSC